MTMDGPWILLDMIVLLAVAFAIVFLAAWLISPSLRVWIERPKHRFLADIRRADLQNYSEATGMEPPPEEETSFR